METRTVEQVESWSTRSFADGYAGLRELSDGEFSGAVRAGGAWLFMLNGRIIGVYEGSLDDFEDAEGTAYAAPHPSLPLLFSMQEQGGETQAKYYTNDTPLSEVDSTLTSGSFTGYVELSENVLSGDYYVAYYGGRSMSVAFVGASEQVVTGEEAFERANDEVGIYEVRDVSIDVIDVPEPEEPDPDESDSAGGANETSASSSGSAASAGDTPSNDANVDPSNDASVEETAGEVGGTQSGQGSRGQSAHRVEETGPSAGADRSSTASAAAPDDEGRPAGTRTEAETTDSGAEATDASAPATDANTQATDTSAQATDANASGASARTDAGDHEDAGGPATDDRANASAPGENTSPGAPSPETTSSRASGNARHESDTRTEPNARTEPSADSPRRDATSETDDEENEQADGAFADEEEWRETTTIPSLDPDRSEGPDGAASGASASDDRDSSDRPSGKSASESRSDESAGTGRGRSDRQSGSRSNERSRSNGAGSKQSQSGASGPERSESGASGPEQSQSGASGRSASASETDAAPSGAPGTGRASGTNGSSGANGRSGANGPSGAGSAPSGSESGSGEASDEAKERIRKLRSQLKQRKQQVQQLKSRLSDVESERNEYKRERDALRQEVERLEAKLETSESDASGSDKRQLDRAQAFDGTNLFVRYESKGKATLDEAAEGKVEADDVNANLRLEHHTQFEAEEVAVSGESFESFLTDSFEYQFVSWIIEELLYEIRDTGHRASLKDLYESIPKIDRVDLHGSVSAGSGDDDTRQESFDIIMRDRMGNPLVVADLNDSRDPTTGEMMGSLVDAASGVAGTYDELSGAFQVTESFFEPEALETTESATSGGFLSREKRESFVKLSRKRGYHLCLVESRSGGFHLNVPEL
jgi:hypothetical protein